MAFDLSNFAADPLDAEYLSWLLEHESPAIAARHGRLWNYFLNPSMPVLGPAADAMNSNSRPYMQAQEAGLPPRITGVPNGGDCTDLHRKEVVIENDIAWRIHTMTDYLFGKAPTIHSLARDAETARAVEAVLDAMFDANGGIRLLQELALLGSLHGFADVALRSPAGGAASHSNELDELLTNLPSSGPLDAVIANHTAPSRPGDDQPQNTDASGAASGPENQPDPRSARSNLQLRRAIESARSIRLETVDAARVLPILDEDDCGRIRYWVQRYVKRPARLAEGRKPRMAFGWWKQPGSLSQAEVEVVEILGATWWQRYEDRQLVAEGENALGRVPVVHMQNLPLPGSYAGLGDVEPLMPLQDELNIRLSDRASRVTFQSFKMYLGKGIDDFLERPVAPGQMWATHNTDAQVEEFGSDTGSPSEDAHIEQIRQAMDKISGVTPLAAGLVGGSIGNLTSATALKVVLSGLLARTAKKRLTYGAGIKELIDVALTWLDLTGDFPTAPEDRRVELHWPTVLPTDDGDELRNALTKVQLGVPADRVLAELGYGEKSLGFDS